MKKLTTPFLLAIFAAACGSGSKTQPYCGDKTIGADEECEPGDLGGKSCADLGFAGGVLACTDHCTLDTSRCLGFGQCGNDLVEEGEECEPKLALVIGCQDLGFYGGQLTCTSECFIDASGCADCSDDAQEENDSFATAKEITPGENPFVLCNRGGEEDWFSFPAGAGAWVVIQLSHAPVVDLDVQLYNEAGALLAESAEAFISEKLEYTPSASGRLLVRVFAFADSPGTTEYTLDLAIDPECLDSSDCRPGTVCRTHVCVAIGCSEQNPCPAPLVCHESFCAECEAAGDCPEADAYQCQENRCIYACTEDELEPNSDPTQAAVIGPGSEKALSLCGAYDSDWFRVALEARKVYRVELAFSHAQGDIDLDVYKASDLSRPVASSRSDDDGEQVTLAVKTAGDYLIAVSLGFGQLAQNYTLSFNDQGPAECVEDQDCAAGSICSGYRCLATECQSDGDCQNPKRCQQGACVGAPAGDDCASAISVGALPFTYQLDDVGPYRDRVAFAAGDCTADGTSGKDVVFVVSLQAGESIRVTVVGDYDLALVLSSACSATPAAPACLAAADNGLDGEAEEVVYTATAAGPVYIIVDSFAPLYPETGSFHLSVAAD